jgi:FkbM family methyltransferase
MFKFLKEKKQSIESYLDLMFLFSKQVTMLQVGANDGSMCDPIRKFVLQGKLKGIMLEPQPEVFIRLVDGYQSVEGLTFINAALSDREGTMPLYLVDPDLVSQYKDLSGVASFSKDHVHKEIKSNLHRLKLPKNSIDACVCSVEVGTLTYEMIIQNYKISSLDLLMLDVEGFDYEAIMLFPFDIIKPKAVVYEYKHLSSKKREVIEKKLTSLGYYVFYAKNDALFVLTS